MRPLVEHGHVHIAQPPLYSIRLGRGSKIYAWDEAELATALKKNPKGTVTRFKGLGEMDAPDLSATAMNTDTRRIIQVTIDNMAETERMFSDLMGNDSGARRAYLELHQAKMIDISE
jgi:DNA gyrase/topoisomerase IV subunit B